MRLIDADALKEAIKSYADDQYAENEYLGECSIMSIIDDAPTVETPTIYEFKGCDNCELERPKGAWKKDLLGHTCSNCGWTLVTDAIYLDEMHFCPNCGANMRGEEE